MVNRNISKIEGNNNVVQQGKKNSLQMDSKHANDNHRHIYEIAGFWIAVVTLFVAIIVGWDEIIKFIRKIV